jgi:hypothetical protein
MCATSRRRLSTVGGLESYLVVTVMIATSLAGTGGAAELPIYGSYGELQSCILAEYVPDYEGFRDDIFLSRTTLEGHEWKCDFGAITSHGSHHWELEVYCSGAGDHEDGSRVPSTIMTVEETEDQTMVTLRNPDFFDGDITLPSCLMSSYEDQVRREMARISQ